MDAVIYDPAAGTGETFDAIFAAQLEHEAEVYADPIGNPPHRY